MARSWGAVGRGGIRVAHSLVAIACLLDGALVADMIYDEVPYIIVPIGVAGLIAVYVAAGAGLHRDNRLSNS